MNLRRWRCIVLAAYPVNMESDGNPLPGVSVSVQTDLPAGGDSLPALEWLAGAVLWGLAQVLEGEAIGEVSLLITDDATVRRLNREYRGLDETTDVLAFSAEHWGHWVGDGDGRDVGDDLAADWPLGEGETPPLGDIVVSLPQAERQAEGQGISLRRELALLLAHGALHLVGQDHYDDGERAEMQGLEGRALAAILKGDED